MAFYTSPRWSGEILDCSMPMTFDQYNRCSFDCMYCFSFFQRALIKYKKRTKDKRLYTQKPSFSVNVEQVKRLFNGELPESQFKDYIADQIPMQWGGLSDPFDMFEKKYGVGLEILKHLYAMKYPICFSTKGTWWVKDKRYMDMFRGNDFWNVKCSIINLHSGRAKLMERGVPSPMERLDAMNELVQVMGPKGGGVTLRLRPFIVGLSDRDNEHIELVQRAAKAGATAVSMEFLCVESRCTPESRERFDQMGEIIGMDLLDFYRKNTVNATGYLRLNWKIKQPFVEAVERECKKTGMRFYVSDAHWKDKCPNGNCCGLGEKWNYHRGQFTEALMIAKTKGTVTWDDLYSQMLPTFDRLRITSGSGVNIARVTPGDRARFRKWSFTDYFRYIWNSPNHPRSPYRYFFGLLQPKNKDKQGNIVYEYCPYVGTGTGKTGQHNIR